MTTPPYPSPSPKTRLRRAAAALMAATALASMSGCAMTGGEEPLPPEELEAIALGANGEAGDVAARSIVIVAADEGEPGRLLGTVFNRGDDAVEVELSDADDSVLVEIPAGDLVALEEQEFLMQTVEQIPGSYVEITLAAGGEEVTLQVPVRDGSLEAYAPYLPEG
ncbi:hypothetical protein [Agromyces indicus]|uniref:Copper chaperone PCu(A)C n=1 Tax=Agromyces indicus TaxID=758919 RepID=A0ABU1FGU6_9MICO|nr:hypothetical protein [Agromyces indicus]MDR5690968.1 hypothetical protein [Agromyces indicus]